MYKTIAFVTGGLEFNGDTIKEKALGGSESAMIYMAREMAKLGHEVTVYCNCDRPGVYDNVLYRGLDSYMFDDRSQFDVLIVSRFTDFLALPIIDSKLNILWCHDIDSSNFRDALGVASRVFCLSDYHKSLFVDNYQIEPSNYVWKTSNGYDQEIVTVPVPYEAKKNNYIYASRPERGMKPLLEKIWPEILEKNPDAILNICGYEHTLGAPDEVKKLHREVEELLDYTRNVKIHGSLPKQKYYELLSNCAYMIYPTDFPEISCINAIEAQFNGCLVVTTNKYALAETVKSKTKVKSFYGTQEYLNEFMGYLDEFQGEKYEAEVAKCREMIKSYSWANIAKQWDREIDSMFQKRFEKYKDKIIDQLVYSSDIYAAWKLTGDMKYRKLMDDIHHRNLTKVDFREFEKDEDTYLNYRGVVLIDQVEKIIKQDPTRKLKILDLGCNDGILSFPLMKRFSDNIEEMTMYDSCEEVLDFMKRTYTKKYPQLRFIYDDVSNMEQHPYKADVVIIGELLEHIEDVQSFLCSLMKFANKDTLFYFTVPKGPWEGYYRGEGHLTHVQHFERTDLHQIFKHTNLQIDMNKSVSFTGRRNESCSNWMFWFNASENDNIEFGEVDYQTKWLKTRPYKTISCCMIVKDEEDNLSRCLKSVKDIADEIVIVDTGSTDETKRIAGKFTDKVYDLNWLEEDGLGNFSRARNYSIDQATGDYILWIDADEQLENGQAMFKYITSDYYDGMLLKQQQCMSKASHDSGINVDVMHDRLFKRGNIRFTGVVHEYPSKDDEHFLGKMFWQGQASILHYGLANQQMLKKKSIGRNADLIYKNVRTYPDRIFAKHYILVDHWSQFITGHPNPDLSLLEKGMDMWHNVLKVCGDDWTIRLSLGVVQHFYHYCAVNGIAYKGKLPEKTAFKNNNGEVLEFFVLDYDEEAQFFLKYLSEFNR